MQTSEVTASLMHALRAGNREAGVELVDLFYPELRRLAAAQMKNERIQHTWQPSALVHELYLEILKTKGLRERDYGDSERKAFFALAGQMMKRLLIHHARPLYRRVERVGLGDSEEYRDQVRRHSTKWRMPSRVSAPLIQNCAQWWR